MNRTLEATVLNRSIPRYGGLYGVKRKTYDLIVQLICPLVDFGTVAFAIMLSYGIYRILGIGKQVYYEKVYIISFSLMASLATVIILFIFGAYKRESSLLNMEEIKNVVKGVSFSFLIFALLLVFGKVSPSRYVLVISYFASVILVVLERTAFYHILALTKAIEWLNKRVLIYGAGTLGQALFRSIANSPKLGIIPVGFVDDDLDKHGIGLQSNSFGRPSYDLSVLGSREDIGRLTKELKIDEVYVAISNIDNENLINILEVLKGENVRTSFVPNLCRVFVHKVKIERIGEIPIVREEEEERTAYSYAKRYIDLFLGAVSLCLLWPIFVIISLAIRIDSKGPIFFWQNRVGRDGKVFEIYKFRSMSVDTDPYAVNPLDKNDPRITRVGRFLRKTSLDELPQIINVLKGDMSFVGPRPEMPFIVEDYDEIHKERLKILPGITGLWQLSGDRKKPIHENMEYDLYYIKNCSFFLDVAILIESVMFSLRGI